MTEHNLNRQVSAQKTPIDYNWVQVSEMIYRNRAGFELAIPDLSLASRRVVAVLGGNGSGKTTLMRLILGIIRPETGKIVVLGKHVQNLEIKSRNQLGVQWQNKGIDNAYDVKDILGFYKSVYDSIDHTVYDTFNVKELIGKRLSALSSGEMQRLLIYLALAHSPKFAIMDEPTSNLDAKYTEKFTGCIEKIRDDRPEFGAFIITHAREVVDVCDDILLLMNGEIIAFGRREDVILKLFGERGVRLEGDKTLLSKLLPQLKLCKEIKSVVERKGSLVLYGTKKLNESLPILQENKNHLKFATWQCSAEDVLEKIKHEI